jgi:uncharacterized OB-fold protein
MCTYQRTAAEKVSIVELGYTPPMLLTSTAETAGFFEAARDGVLTVEQCATCRRFRHPPRLVCPACRSFERRWQPVSGRGHIWSWIVVHPPLLAGFAELAPYNVVTVELVEGANIRFVGNLVEEVGGRPNEIDPPSIVIGEAVHAVFALAEDVPILQWVRD